MDLSIIIVNYKTKDLTEATIDSAIETIHDIDYEIIVVDNNSCDGSYETLTERYNDNSYISIIENDTNAGFAKANNLGFKYSSGDYILLLNSDVVLQENTVNNTLDYIQNHENVGAIGPRVLLPDGTLDKACRRSFPTPSVSFYRFTGLSRIFPKSKRFNRYNLSYLDKEGVYSIECIVGAYILTTRKLYDKFGLNESYFMYGEDIELCYNIINSGYEIVYYGKNSIIHYKGASGKNKRLLYEFHNSMDIFYKTHYADENNFIVNSLIYLSIWGLYYVKLIRLLITG